jgi:hypothetical protein
VAYGGNICKVCLDALITTLPLPLVLGLQMNRRSKYWAVGLIAIGYMITAAGAMRVYYMHIFLWESYDVTWYNYYASVATSIESDLSVVGT